MSEQNIKQQEQQQQHNEEPVWLSKEDGYVRISEMSNNYLQSAYYRSLGKINHHEKELKKQRDLYAFWNSKASEVEEELKKRNMSLDTFLNIKGESDEPMNVVGDE